MHLGIFAKTFPRPTLEETLDAVVDHGSDARPVQHVVRRAADAARSAR